MAITSTFQHSYHKAFQALAQQMKSRLRDAVTNYPTQGEAIDVPQIASTAAQEVSASNQSTSAISMTTKNRRIAIRRFNHPMLVDRFDQQRTIIDLKSPYVRNGVMSLNRSIDDLIISAATGWALTGKYGTSSTAFDATMTVTLSAGWSVERILETKRLLDAEENDEQIDRYLVISSLGLKQLLGQTQVTSSDYAAVKALVNGELSYFAGFNFIRSERMTISQGLAWAKDAMGLAVGEDIYTEVGPRRDLNNSDQIYLEFMLGASRLREKGVVKIINA